MRNTLSFFNTMFLLLLIGKIGHVGTLGTLHWAIIALPMLCDLFLDFLLQMGYIDRGILKIKAYLIRLKLNKISKQIKANKQ